MAAEYFRYLWTDFLKIDLFWKPGATRVQKYFYIFDICHIDEMTEFRDLSIRHLEKNFIKFWKILVIVLNPTVQLEGKSDDKWLSGIFFKFPRWRPSIFVIYEAIFKKSIFSESQDSHESKNIIIILLSAIATKWQIFAFYASAILKKKIS